MSECKPLDEGGATSDPAATTEPTIAEPAADPAAATDPATTAEPTAADIVAAIELAATTAELTAAAPAAAYSFNDKLAAARAARGKREPTRGEGDGDRADSPTDEITVARAARKEIKAMRRQGARDREAGSAARGGMGGYGADTLRGATGDGDRGRGGGGSTGVPDPPPPAPPPPPPPPDPERLLRVAAAMAPKELTQEDQDKILTQAWSHGYPLSRHRPFVIANRG